MQWRKKWVIWIFSFKKSIDFWGIFLASLNWKSAALESLNSYFDAFIKFVEISILLENSFGFGNLSNFEQIVHEDLAKVCQIDCGEHENLIELLDHVKIVDIKKTHKKIQRLT